MEGQFPGREKQISQLRALFGQPGDSPIPSIFVYGVTATGKTSVVRALMEEGFVLAGSGSSSPYVHAFVDCVEAFSPKILFEHILNQISGVMPSLANGFRGYCRCEHISSFVRELARAIDLRGVSNDLYWYM